MSDGHVCVVGRVLVPCLGVVMSCGVARPSNQVGFCSAWHGMALQIPRVKAQLVYAAKFAAYTHIDSVSSQMCWSVVNASALVASCLRVFVCCALMSAIWWQGTVPRMLLTAQ